MFKTIKKVAILFAFIFTITSCYTSIDEQEPRTQEMEDAEINAALKELEEIGYDIDTTDLGVYYIIQKEGTGSFPAPLDTCFMEYTGYFIDGTVFDSSHDHFEYGIWEFNYLEIALIPGFDDGIALLNKGAEIEMIIPSSLAYGSTGTSGVPPYATLFFSTKMHDLKPVSVQ